MLYQEKSNAGNRYRNEYLSGISELVERQRAVSDQRRAAYFSDINQERERYRQDFIKMLGWPLTEPVEYRCEHDCASSVSATFVAEDELSVIYRLQMTVLGGLKNYAMLFLPRSAKPCPVAIIQHGGGGTPELCAHLFSDSNYNDMTRRLLKRGMALLSPQLLLWRKGRFGKGYDRVKVDGQLKQLGGSITALEIYGIQRWIDYLETRADLDTGTLGMTGLSYGGFYTLFTTALETRIRVAYSSCFFNSRYRYDWTDWTWTGAAERFLDAEVGALICPRPLYIEIGRNDPLFDCEAGRAEFLRLKAFYESAGAGDCVRLAVNAGAHEYARGDEGIDFLIRHMSAQ